MPTQPNTVRRPAVAGMFYPDRPAELERQVRGLLDEAARRVPPDAPVPKAIIAPHAGYPFSGPVAATIYARLAPARGRIRRVVLIGPAHRVPVRGLALSGAERYDTPLGPVPIDRAAEEAIGRLPQVSVNPAAHAPEHSLEVHLPFLQVALGDFELVPLVAGWASDDEVAEVLDTLWGGPETLIVISSDLSHFLDYDSARDLDAETCRAIESLDPGAIGDDQACGRIPVKGLLTLARRRGLAVSTLDLRNSGDTAGPRDRVVGYGAWAFVETGDDGARAGSEGAAEATASGGAFAAATRALLERHGPGLLRLAAASIRHGLEHGSPLEVDRSGLAPELAEDGACFVTLKRDGQLRGCIGSAEAHRPLAVDVAENAFAAAFRDPRFPPLGPHELAGLDLSISVLGRPSPLVFDGESDLLARLRPGVDGLIIEDGPHRALFLPQVWEQLPDPRQFLRHLRHKAGLDPDRASPTMTASTFVCEAIGLIDLPDPAAVWTEASIMGEPA